MADVFISYKREDRSRVLPLIQALERSGLSVWFDDGIEPGDEWFGRILDELERSSLTLGIWSSASINDRGQFVPNSQNKYYVKIEHDRTKVGRLIPIQLDSNRAALEFSHLQIVDLVGWDGNELDSRCIKLIDRVRALLGRSQTATPASATDREHATSTPQHVWRVLKSDMETAQRWNSQIDHIVPSTVRSAKSSLRPGEATPKEVTAPRGAWRLFLLGVFGFVMSMLAVLAIAIVHAFITGGKALNQTLGGTGPMLVVIIATLVVGTVIPLLPKKRRRAA